MNDTIFYCDECGNEENYEIIHKTEEVTIKDVTFENEHEYCQCSVCKELYEPLDDADKNIKSDYAKYREIKHLLSPEDITSIREKYELSQRRFAELLGISHSTLSRIENGALQNEYQNNLFLMASAPEAFLKVIQNKKTLLSEDEFKSLDNILVENILRSIPEYKPRMDKLDRQIEYIYDVQNAIQRKINTISVNSKPKEIDNGGSVSWIDSIKEKTLTIFNISKQN